MTAMFVERNIWKKQPWAIYAYFLKAFNPIALVMDPALVFLLYKSVNSYDPAKTTAFLCLLFAWLMFTKTVKLIPYLWRNPSDIKFLPAHFAFGYFHGLIKMYSFFTLHKTGWAGRLNVDENEDDTGANVLELSMAVDIDTLDDDGIATPGVPRLLENGEYELPRPIVKPQPQSRPNIFRSDSTALLQKLRGLKEA